MGLDPKSVHKPVRKLRKLLKTLPKQPSPEDVHQLRTNARRLEAMIASLSLERDERRLLKNLGKIRKKAGGVRDMDVLIGYVPVARGNGEQTCRVRLLENLGEMRRKQAKKLHAVISSKGGSAWAALNRVDRRLKKALCEKQKRNCNPVAARLQATASALTLESALALPRRLGKQNLHPYRLKVKQLQNVLRLGEGSKNQEFLKALGAVKDAIGEWHDWEELKAIASEVLDHGARCQIMQEIRKICEQKYEVALSETLQMRRKYLRLPSVKRAGVLRQAANPVWDAMAAIAA